MFPSSESNSCPIGVAPSVSSNVCARLSEPLLNSKATPRELRGAFLVGGGTLSANVYNLFNQDAFIQGYLGEGVPLALNQYATKASYAPYLGASATELFGLPYRSFFVSYSLQVR
jgi:hypothetical protein